MKKEGKITGGCLIRIRSYQPSLNKAQQRLSDFILSNAEVILPQSITMLAQSSGVSVATVSRLCRIIGFPGFQEMKAALRVDLLSPESGIYPRIQDGDSARTIVEKVFTIAKTGIGETLSLLDEGELARAAEKIATARKVEFFGAGSASGPIAALAANKFLNLGISTGSQVDPLLQRRAAEHLSAADVAFGISHSGISVPVTESIRIAKERGATTICLTNYAGSPLTGTSDIVLLTAIERDAPLFGEAIASRIPQICIIDSLYAVISLLRYREVAGNAGRR